MNERKKSKNGAEQKSAETFGRLFSALKTAKRTSEVKERFFISAGIDDFVERDDKTDLYGDVLFVFKKEKKLTPQKLAAFIAQAVYSLRRIRREEAAPLPAYLCGVCREEAFLCETQPFAHFYGKRAEKEYDWDRTPASPCPVLIRDLLSSSALFSVRVYSLQNEEDERAFRAALSCACGTQLSLFPKQKKPITEENFEKVYEYWASLFAPYLNEKRGDKKLAEYFLADALRGGKHNKNGRVDFLLESGGETHRLPVYEYNYFWSIYERVADETVAFSLRRKIDRLGEDADRRLQGEFYTPARFAQKAYAYLEKTIGKKRLTSGEYRVWDMAAGSGNLEFTLPAALLPYTYISTLLEEDAMYCKRVFPHCTVFTYDYLNDDVPLVFRRRDTKKEETDGVYAENPMLLALNEIEKREEIGRQISAAAETDEPIDEAETGERRFARKMPANLLEDLQNPRLKWLIFINPPFATSNTPSLSQGKTSKTGVSDTAVRREMLSRGLGETGRELFSQFLFRIAEEFKGKTAYLGLFSTLKYLNAPNDKKLRETVFRYGAERGFVFSSENFSGSKGRFPVAFIVWNMQKNVSVEAQTIQLDVFNERAEKIGVKRVETGEVKPLSAWVKRPKNTRVFPPFTGAFGVGEHNADVRDKVADGFICSLMCCGNDIQHQNQTALFSGPQASAGSYSVVKANFEKSMAVHAARRLAVPAWSNNRDQFRAPSGELSRLFYTDCAVWSVFSDSNNACSFENVAYKGETYRVRNNLFPFTIAEVESWGVPLGSKETDEGESFFALWLKGRRLSKEASAVMEKARAFYKYCYVNQFAPIWDAGYMQLKNAVAEDAEGKKLLTCLKNAHKKWSAKLLKDVIDAGMIPEDVRYFDGAAEEE
ncbi:MAG: hypothetical protein SPH68_00685 [Candidatus Borkfalkiaceae bacterium]|nr:hypothetical protein [Clostridia bacterium]MDY6222663.1 hypothetical protein [Christensenellaceae bacterium]